jgi:hypothetical protein
LGNPATYVIGHIGVGIDFVFWRDISNLLLWADEVWRERCESLCSRGGHQRTHIKEKNLASKPAAMEMGFSLVVFKALS